MTLHQYLTNWFKQFKINVLPEERKTVTENFMSGYECKQLERCPFVHMLASLVANKRNPSLLDEYIESEEIEWGDPRNVTSDEWIHMLQLIIEWSDEENLND